MALFGRVAEMIDDRAERHERQADCEQRRYHEQRSQRELERFARSLMWF